MIEFAPKGIASYFLSDTFLGDDYDMILCNWTLHFIKDKENYLKAMADGLKDGGTMILSEKTSKDTDLIKMYHDNKLKLGVTEEQIKMKKAQELKEVLNEFMNKRKDLKEFEKELKKNKHMLTPGQVGES